MGFALRRIAGKKRAQTIWRTLRCAPPFAPATLSAHGSLRVAALLGTWSPLANSCTAITTGPATFSSRGICAARHAHGARVSRPATPTWRT